MNVVFIGSSSFGLRCLETCLTLPEVKLKGIVTVRRTFRISYRPSGVTNVNHADLAAYGHTQGIPVITLEHAMNDNCLFDAVKSWQPDVFLVAGWYHMIPKHWRNLAPAYGLHASLLPDYSGGAPLVWAMINGESRTGITLFQMDDGIDSGPIAAQAEEEILPDDTIATLYSRIENRGVEMLGEALPKLAKGVLPLQIQDESKRRVMPQRSPEDGNIDWHKEATFIDRFIRAQTRPYPGAFSSLNGKNFHIWQACLQNDINNSEPGRIYRNDSGQYLVLCGCGTIRLVEISYDTKNYTAANLFELLGTGGQKLFTPASLKPQVDS